MTSIISGTFTSNATPVAFTLPLESGYDYFEMWNITDIGDTAATTQVMRARALSAMTPGQAYISTKTSAAATLALEKGITSGGFTFFNSANPPVFAGKTVIGITAASPASVNVTAHGYVVGDTVRFINLNGTMQPMNGLTFTVDTITDADNFKITFDSSGAVGGTPATAGTVTKVFTSPWSPHNVIIGPTATINAGNSLLLNMNTVPSKAQGASQYIPFLRPYQPGAILRFYLPSGFGTSLTANFLIIRVDQVNLLAGYTVANQLQCTILNGNPVGSATTAAGLGALTYPAGAAGYNGQFPFVTDIAEVVQDLSEAEDNTGINGIIIGTAVQALGGASGAKTWQWFARQGFVQPLLVT